VRLLITPACEAVRVCREAAPSHLLRLVSPDQADGIANLTAEGVLTLVVHDILEPTPGRIAPDPTMIRTLLDFGRDWSGERPLVVQCWAGVSRSTAAAFIIACEKRPHVPEKNLAAALRRAAPQATPNRLMVAHADALLGRAGRMIAAIQSIGRGTDFTGFACAELTLDSKAAKPRASLARHSTSRRGS
jgi:predicted protein tyrosine phosphatase